MKRILITDNVLVPSDIEGQMKTLYVGTVADIDDNTAGLVVAAGRGSYVRRADDGKYERELVDTAPVEPAPAQVSERARKVAE